MAESLGISNMTDEVALALAADVEYRLREIVEVGCTLYVFLAGKDGS